MSDRLIGKVLGDFRLEERIGKGNLGKVYRSTQVSLGRPVAVKILEEGVFTTSEHRERFLREAQVIARLEHPNIIPVYAAGVHEGLHFYAMRLVKGRTLQEAMAAGMPLGDGLRYLADVAGALAHAHERGVVHRDVKPANIMITEGVALLADFGLARLLESSTITSTGQFLGTPLYFSPEQARRQPATGQSDVYSLGIVLYELAAGRHPFETAMTPDDIIRVVSNGIFEPPSKVRPGIPRNVEEIILQAMQTDPLRRFPNARAFRQELLGVCTSGSVHHMETSRIVRASPAPAPSKPSEPGGKKSKFGKYVLHDILGHGGMGIVYRAEQPELERMIALKMLPPEEAANPTVRSRFLHESRAAARLRHPGIVSIHEVGEIDGSHYFTMDLIEGTPLERRVHAGPIPVKEALSIARDVARAVHYAHTQNIIHRDIKPANILTDPAGRVYVTDFGLAKEVRSDVTALTRSGDVFGTPSYMPPEQARGDMRSLDARSDVYALGATLYHLLTGRPPFNAESPMQTMMDVIEKEPVEPRAINPQIPVEAQAVCLKALEKNPADRYASAAEMSDDIDRFLAGRPVQAKPAHANRRPAPAAFRRASSVVEQIEQAQELMMPQDLARLEADALGDFARAMESDPSFSESWYWRARFHFSRGRPEEAEQDIEKYLGLVPKSCPGHVLRGRILLARYHEGLDLPAAVWTPAGNAAAAPVPETDAARALKARGRASLAEVARGGLEGGAPKPAETQFIAGLTDLLGGKYAEASRALESAAEEGALLAETHYYRGLAFHHAGDYAAAVKHFKACGGTFPGAVVQHALGRARHQGGVEILRKGQDPSELFQEAERHFRRALQEPSPRPLSSLALADLLETRANYRAARGRDGRNVALFGQAIEDLTEAMRWKPNAPSQYNSRGLAHQEIGLARMAARQDPREDFARAIEDFDTALDLNPGFAAALFNRAETKAARGRHQEMTEGDPSADHTAAIEDYTRLLAAHPDHARSYLSRANSYYGRCRRTRSAADLDAAEKDCTAYLKILPKDAYALRNRGLVRHLLGRHREAIEDWNASFALKPEYRKGFEALYEEARRKSADDIALKTPEPRS